VPIGRFGRRGGNVLVGTSAARNRALSPWMVWLPIGLGLVFIGGVIVLVVVQARRAQGRRLAGAGRSGGANLGGPPPGPPPGDRELDPEQAAFWLHLAPGDQVSVSDVVAFADALEAGVGSIHGTDYKIASVTHAEGEGGEQLVLALLDDARQPLLLLASVRAGSATLRLFHRPPGAPAGNRADLLDAGAFWLFGAPPDPDRFRPADLAFTLDLIQDVEVRFERVAEGERSYRAASRPRSPDGEVFPLRVVAYRADTTATDPWLVALERGGAGSDLGGYVELWQGCELRSADLSVTPGAFVGVDLAG
jgi:hypothetical protein